MDDVKQPQESYNIVASTGEWLVCISNDVYISTAYISVNINYPTSKSTGVCWVG
jgi:hypothetical protein